MARLRGAHRTLRKRAIFARDGGLCWLCGTKVDFDASGALAPTFDHVIPVSAGGTNDFVNLKLAHAECNNRRGNRRAPDHILDAVKAGLVKAEEDWWNVGGRPGVACGERFHDTLFGWTVTVMRVGPSKAMVMDPKGRAHLVTLRYLSLPPRYHKLQRHPLEVLQARFLLQQ